MVRRDRTMQPFTSFSFRQLKLTHDWSGIRIVSLRRQHLHRPLQKQKTNINAILRPRFSGLAATSSSCGHDDATDWPPTAVRRIGRRRPSGSRVCRSYARLVHVPRGERACGTAPVFFTVARPGVSTSIRAGRNTTDRSYTKKDYVRMSDGDDDERRRDREAARRRSVDGNSRQQRTDRILAVRTRGL